MHPPPVSSVASRLFLGPALRAQSDRRLVSLVRDGYENAFEEIVRRYDKPLARYAAAIVSANRAEDVTQDAFSKALLALRDTDKEIELRPWLYRIVRNTALNDLRDRPPAAAPLHEGIDGVETPPQAAERREEVAELLKRLRALPDPQRAAIVMRELEGLSHEEIAAALGMTGGAARQTIHRARRTLRNGAGMLIPIPLLHYLLAPSAEGVAAGAGLGGAAAAGAGAAAGGGAGAGVALKAGVATVLVAGSVGTGVVLHDSSRDRGSASAAETPSKSEHSGAAGSPQSDSAGDPGNGSGGDERGGPGPDRHGGEREAGDDHGGRRSSREGSGEGGSQSGPGPSSGGREGGDESQSGPGGDGSGSRSDSGHSGSGSGSDGSGGGDGSPDLIPGDD
jgi:RNA polymerase sigma factor (sigma-70 family)